MCHHCVIQISPDRGRTCLDIGAFVINYRQCHQCQKRAPLVVNNYELIDEINSEDEDEANEQEENISYNRKNNKL